MRLGLMVVNGLVLTAVACMGLMGPGEQHATAVLGPDRELAKDLAALEQDAVRDPSVPATAALANAYLAHEQPGLASAVIAKAPVAVRETPEIAHIYARTLFHRGHAREALAVAERASDACESGCPGWLVAATSRQVSFLGEVVSEIGRAHV